MTQFIFNEDKGLRVDTCYKSTEGLALFDFAKNHSTFAGKAGEIYYLPSMEGQGQYLLGLGDRDKLDLEALRKASFNLARAAKDNKTATLHLNLNDFELDGFKEESVLEALMEGFWQAEYKFSRKSDLAKDEDDSKGQDEELEIAFLTNLDEAAFHKTEEQIRNLIDGLFLARDLVNQTSNEMYPEVLADKVKDVFQDLPVEVRILDEHEIQDLGMEAFYSVAKGSDRPPRFIIMEYDGGEEGQEKTALVGKGLTYDSGGYCIKSARGMSTMHCDMGGAGTVIGTLLALAKNKVPVNVVAVVAACENLISGSSYKTGDIIGSLSGKTIEVGNTDAEGRLTLADAVYFATDTLKADRLIDLATLTGAVIAALSDEYTGAITNDEAYFEGLQEVAKTEGEKIWLLPNDENLAKKNRDTKVADVLNSTSGGAGTITAGQFVGEFLAREVPWIHLDIAGTAYGDRAKGYVPERATGVLVKSLYRYLSLT